MSWKLSWGERPSGWDLMMHHSEGLSYYICSWEYAMCVTILISKRALGTKSSSVKSNQNNKRKRKEIILASKTYVITSGQVRDKNATRFYRGILSLAIKIQPTVEEKLKQIRIYKSCYRTGELQQQPKSCSPSAWTIQHMGTVRTAPQSSLAWKKGIWTVWKGKAHGIS